MLLFNIMANNSLISDYFNNFVSILINMWHMDNKNIPGMNNEQNDMIIYHSKDGKINVALMTRDGDVWLNQSQIATLFGTSKQNVGQHIANILKDNELGVNSVIKNYFTTASDGKQYEAELADAEDKKYLDDLENEIKNNHK